VLREVSNGGWILTTLLREDERSRKKKGTVIKGKREIRKRSEG